MKQHYNNTSVEDICRLFGKSRQAWYDLHQRTADRQLGEGLLLQWVVQIRDNLPRIGGVKLYHLLKESIGLHSLSIGRDAFFSFLRKQNLLIQPKKKYVYTTQSFHHFRKWSNLVENLPLSLPEQLWVSDITYLRTETGFLYLFLITDAYSRKIVGYHLSQHLKANGCIAALLKAIRSRMYAHHELIHHSDRGLQYCCDEYVTILRNNDISISMTQTGSPYDNAIAERVNGILKQEFALDKVFPDYSHAVEPVSRAIHLYNKVRPHFSCGLKTPEQTHSFNPNPEK
jgi:hypothetical protein